MFHAFVVVVIAVAGSFVLWLSVLIVGALLVARAQEWFSPAMHERPMSEQTLDTDAPHSVPSSVH